MSYIIAEHQSVTKENGTSHKKVIIFFAKIVITRCTRGDARSFFCTYKTYLYAQNYFLKNIFKYCFKSYIKLHEYANCNSANYDV